MGISITLILKDLLDDEAEDDDKTEDALNSDETEDELSTDEDDTESVSK